MDSHIESAMTQEKYVIVTNSLIVFLMHCHKSLNQNDCFRMSGVSQKNMREDAEALI